jgi:anaerobic sulfite reductase subunit B
MENPYKPKKYKVLKRTQESSDTFTIRLDMRVKHDPGQFVQLSLPGIGEAPISICSYSDKHLDLNIREVGNVTKNLADVKKGDTILARGPYGKGYPMHNFKGNSIIIIGGGCGFAPLKGIVEYIEKNRDDFKDVILFLGFRDPNEVLFKKQLEEWKGKYHISVTVDNKPSKTCWDGRVGFVTNMLQESDITNENKVVFICGPPIMMKACIDILNQKGFNDDQIYVSAERMMNCAIGICGHCMIHGKYVCLDGPVFRWDELREDND